jgi:hypothetical protein
MVIAAFEEVDLLGTGQFPAKPDRLLDRDEEVGPNPNNSDRNLQVMRLGQRLMERDVISRFQHKRLLDRMAGSPIALTNVRLPHPARLTIHATRGD